LAGLGAPDGESVASALDEELVGANEGITVDGSLLGEKLGSNVTAVVGKSVGDGEGICVGISVVEVGARDGDVVGGALHGRPVSADGTDGPSDANIASRAGNGDGSDIGRSVGCIVIFAALSIGASVGSRVGTRTPVGFEEAFSLD
jgi:hypothetical protein